MTMIQPPTVTPNSRIALSRSALQHNMDGLREIMDGVRICMVVKSHAYGHGVQPVVESAQGAGVDEFATFSAQSAELILPTLEPDSTLHIMGQIDPSDLPWAFEHGVQVWVHDLARWDAILELSKEGRLKGPARIHLELETGMNRTGLESDDAFHIAERIQEMDDIELAGVCTHLAGAESQQNDPRIQDQADHYEAFLERLGQAGIDPGTRHACSSAAALVYPELRYDMVRIGIAAYGYWPAPEVQARAGKDTAKWKPVPTMRWVSSIMSIKEVEEGEWIGYGQGFQALEDSRIAIIPVGYGDGLTRGLSNLGYVIIHGSRCPIVGFVNMNMIQVDVTHLPEAVVGDDVVLIGQQGDCTVSVRSFAEANDIVNYELMTRLSLDIPRYLVD